MPKHDAKTIRKAIKRLGGNGPASRSLNVDSALVWQWAEGVRPVAPKHCIPIELATEGFVTRYDLRPDVFGTADNDHKNH